MVSNPRDRGGRKISVVSGFRFNTVADFQNIDGTKWNKKARAVVLEVMKEAARMWLLYIAKTVPRDTGFLLGAFTPLADMLNVKILTVGQGVSVRAGLKKSPGYLRLKLERDQARVEAFKRRRVLEAFRRQNQQRQRERDSERAQDAQLESQGTDTALSRREYIEQRNMQRAQRKLAIASFKRNRKVYLNLKAKIARLNKKIKTLQAKRINYRAMRESIYSKDIRTRYRTIRVPTKYSQLERMKARAAKKPLPEFTEQRVPIKRGDADSFRNVYRKRYYPGRGQPRGPIKTPTSGQRYATQLQEIFQERSQPPKFVKGAAFSEFSSEGQNITLANLSGQSKPDPTKLTYSFTYDVEIAYYKIMDFLGRYKNHGKVLRPPGTPWMSQRYAERAFRTYLERELPKRLPAFTDYVVKMKSTLNSKGGFTRGFK